MEGHHKQSSLSPNTLLTEFLNSSHSEASFRRLVEQLSGLVYGSALRRTRNAELAEEITQNVFTILSQKAERLVHHPSLNAWIHRTTRYEAEKLLRKESRHRSRIEKFAQEPMNSSSPSPDPADLQLLEQALDQLNQADRELVLARFYQGKKFREIAEDSQRSEAACKMRLKRVLAQMSTWLNRRGHALNITALTALLSRDLTQAAPLKLATSIHLASLPSSATPSLFSILTAMKTSHVITGALSSLLLIAGTTLLLSSRKNNSPRPAQQATKSSSTLDTQALKSNTGQRKLSAQQELETFPLASERLEELYQLFPNLRPTLLEQSDEPNIIEELNLYAEENEFPEVSPELQRKIKAMRSGREEWDPTIVETYLKEHEDILSDLIQLSEYSPSSSRFFLRPTDPSPEGMTFLSASLLLNLSLQHSIRTQKTEEAKYQFEALTRLEAAMTQGGFVHHLIVLSSKQATNKALLSLAHTGHTFPALTSANPVPSTQSAINGLRAEFASLVSLMETFRQSENKVELGKLIGSSIMPINMNEKQPQDPLAMCKKALEPAVHLFEEDYAQTLSQFVSTFEQAEEARQNHDWSNQEALLANLKLKDLDLPERSSPFLRSLLPRASSSLQQIIKLDRQQVALDTLQALDQARADGMNPSQLQDLVPNYLDKVPLHPISQTPITPNSLDPKEITQALISD